MPIRLGTYNPSASKDDQLALMEALRMIGTDAAGIIPDSTNIHFQEAAKVSSINLYESLARYCDEQMSKAVLGQTLTSDSGGGSYAQSKTHNEVRHDLTVADCKALAATIRRDMIRPMVQFNFGDANVPYLRYDCEEAEDQKETVSIYKDLHDMGLKIPTAHLYKKFNIPQPEAQEEIVVKTVSPPFQFPLKTIPLKSGREPDQLEIDRLSDASLSQGTSIFEELAAAPLKLAQSAKSLEELLTLLEDEGQVTATLGNMDASQLEELLYKAMFLADLKGRVMEDG